MTNTKTPTVWGSTLVGWDVTVGHETGGTLTRRITDRKDLDFTTEHHDLYGRMYTVTPIYKQAR